MIYFIFIKVDIIIKMIPINQINKYATVNFTFSSKDEISPPIIIIDTKTVDIVTDKNKPVINNM